MSDLSTKVLLKYCQSWGQSIEEKIEVLNEVVKEAGINAIFQQYEKDGKLIGGWDGSEEDTKRAFQFRQELEQNWFKGNFEEEVAFIASLIVKYKKEGEARTA